MLYTEKDSTLMLCGYLNELSGREIYLNFFFANPILYCFVLFSLMTLSFDIIIRYLKFCFALDILDIYMNTIFKCFYYLKLKHQRHYCARALISTLIL